MNTVELREKRAALIAEAREIVNKENLSAEDQAQVDKMFADADAIEEQYKRAERLEALEARQGQTAGRKTESVIQPVAMGEAHSGSKFGTGEYRSALNNYIRGGSARLTNAEARALSIGSDPAGGYLTFDEFEKALVEKLRQANVMRQLATIISTGGDRQIPVENALGSASWTTEGSSYSESDTSYDRVTLSAYKLTRICKASEELVQDSIFDLNAHLINQFSKSFGIAEETAFANGSGTNQPYGIVNRATLGKSFASASVCTGDELIDVYHALGVAYRNSPKCAWLMADSTAKMIRKLKQTLTTGYGDDNQYLWQPGLQAGQPDMLLGKPVYISSGMPTIASAAKVIVFADFSYYWIADRGNRVLQVLLEKYADTGQIGYRMHERVDGNLTVTEAAVYGKMLG